MAFLGIYLSFNINDCGYFMSILCLLILSNDNVYRLISGFCLLVCFFFYSLILLMYSYIFKKHKKLCMKEERSCVYKNLQSLHVFIFKKQMSYICISIWFFFLFLTHFTLYNTLLVHPPHRIGEGEGGMNRVRNIEIYTLLYVKIDSWW